MISKQLVDLAACQIAQLSIAIALVAIVTRLFCRNRPHLAYALWLLVLIKALTPPIWSSPTGLFSWASSYARVNTAPAIGQMLTVPARLAISETAAPMP